MIDVLCFLYMLTKIQLSKTNTTHAMPSDRGLSHKFTFFKYLNSMKKKKNILKFSNKTLPKLLLGPFGIKKIPKIILILFKRCAFTSFFRILSTDDAIIRKQLEIFKKFQKSKFTKSSPK